MLKPAHLRGSSEPDAHELLLSYSASKSPIYNQSKVGNHLTALSSQDVQTGLMLRQSRGSIINTASMSGLISNNLQTRCAYNAAKAGVIMLTKSLAGEWAKSFFIGSNLVIDGGYTCW